MRIASLVEVVCARLHNYSRKVLSDHRPMRQRRKSQSRGVTSAWCYATQEATIGGKGVSACKTMSICLFFVF
jgi:hypothetical protein